MNCIPLQSLLYRRRKSTIEQQKVEKAPSNEAEEEEANFNMEMSVNVASRSAESNEDDQKRRVRGGTFAAMIFSLKCAFASNNRNNNVNAVEKNKKMSSSTSSYVLNGNNESTSSFKRSLSHSHSGWLVAAVIV